MIINELKCSVITFNFSKSNKKPKDLTLNGNLIKACDIITLLGVIISEDLSWTKNIENIIMQKSE